MTAAAELLTDGGRIVAGYGPDGHFGVLFPGISQKRRHADAFNAPKETGDVIHIVLADTQFFFHRGGQGAKGDLAIAQKLHMVNNPCLQPQFCQGIGIKQYPVPLKNVGAGGGAVSGHIKGMGGGGRKPVSVATPT